MYCELRAGGNAVRKWDFLVKQAYFAGKNLRGMNEERFPNAARDANLNIQSPLQLTRSRENHGFFKLKVAQETAEKN